MEQLAATVAALEAKVTRLLDENSTLRDLRGADNEGGTGTLARPPKSAIRAFDYTVLQTLSILPGLVLRSAPLSLPSTDTLRS